MSDDKKPPFRPESPWSATAATRSGTSGSTRAVPPRETLGGRVVPNPLGAKPAPGPSPTRPTVVIPPLPPLTGQNREFAFTSADFERIRGMLYKHAGISLSPVKQDMVYSRLARRLRATGKKTFAEYLEILEKGDNEEWERFINSLTTNLTSFFREPHHFPLLAAHLQKLQGRRPIRIWCSAASTGEEPYSIAMTVVETFNTFDAPVEIYASDLDTNVLATAQKGVYSGERVERLSPERLRRFFLKGAGGQDGNVCVRPELRRMIQFQRVNLLDASWPIRGPLDVIFCRNVMIYFDKPTQYKILSHFVPLLQQDGLLFAGHSESFLHAADLFRSLGKTVYELAKKKL